MFLEIFNFLFGDTNSRKINSMKKIVDKINILEAYISKLSDNQLKKKLNFLKNLY
ncbi:hypothetical protein RJT40_00695 [Buchnera aphidicola (Shivaphis celti)]